MSLKPQRDAEIAVRLGVVGPDLQRAAVADHCLVRPPEVSQRHTELIVRFCTFGIERQRPAIAVRRLIQSAETSQCVAQVAVRLDVAGFELERPLIAGHRRFKLARVQQRVAEIVVRLGEIRTQRQRAPVAAYGVVIPAPFSEGIAEVIVGCGILRQQSRRLREGVERVFTLHAQRQAQKLPDNPGLWMLFEQSECAAFELGMAAGIEHRHQLTDLRCRRRRRGPVGSDSPAARLVFLPAAARATVVSRRRGSHIPIMGPVNASRPRARTSRR